MVEGEVPVSVGVRVGVLHGELEVGVREVKEGIGVQVHPDDIRGIGTELVPIGRVEVSAIRLSLDGDR